MKVKVISFKIGMQEVGLWLKDILVGLSFKNPYLMWLELTWELVPDGYQGRLKCAHFETPLPGIVIFCSFISHNLCGEFNEIENVSTGIIFVSWQTLCYDT